MSASLHHFRVVCRLLATTRGGLIAVLALINCTPMVAMQMFTRSSPSLFAGSVTVDALVLSLLFAPLARWAIGSTLGQRNRHSAATLLPLAPRSRAVAEAMAVLLALWVPGVVVVVFAAALAGMGWDAELGQVVGGAATLCLALSAMSLPHQLLASLDRQAPYSRRIWIRWLAPPLLAAAGLAAPQTHSLFGYLIVGLASGAVVLAWGPAAWLNVGRRRRRTPGAANVSTMRARAEHPQATLRRDFWRGLARGTGRGALWAVALVGPLVAFRWWRFPVVAGAAALIVIAVVAGSYPLGLRVRVVGGRDEIRGGFARAWSIVPLPPSVVARAVYLHTAMCSAVVILAALAGLAAAIAWYPTAVREVAITVLLLTSVTGLGLVGIRTNTAVGTARGWQLSWALGGSGLACAWVARFVVDSSHSPGLALTLAIVAVGAAVIASLSPASVVRTKTAAS